MLKKYYQSLVSMKYVYFMFGLPLLIFVLAFIETRKKAPILRQGMIVLAIVLAIVMFFYYRDKLKVLKQLKTITNLEEYEKGGVVDQSWILEDRILCCHNFNIQEVSSTSINKVVRSTDQNRKVVLLLYTNEKEVEMSALDQEEASRFVSFVKRKNPSVVLEGIEPKGSGTLQELGAGIQV